MKVYTITIEHIEAFSIFDEELECFPIYNQKTKEQIANVWFNYIGHFWLNSIDDIPQEHFEFSYICLN